MLQHEQILIDLRLGSIPVLEPDMYYEKLSYSHAIMYLISNVRYCVLAKTYFELYSVTNFIV